MSLDELMTLSHYYPRLQIEDIFTCSYKLEQLENQEDIYKYKFQRFMNLNDLYCKITQ